MEKRIKVIQIGVDHDHAANIMDSLRRQKDKFDVIGYVKPDDDSNNIFPGRTEVYEGLQCLSFEQAMNTHIDAVIVESTEKILTKYAFAAAKNGYSVFMDKPGGDIDHEYQRMLDYLEHKSIPFMTGYMYRYNPAVKKVFEMVENGDIGEVIHVEAQMNCLHTPQKRQWLGQYKGGMMFFLGCHLIDLIFHIQGKPETIVPFNMSSGLGTNSGEDYGMAMLKYAHGWSFAKTTAIEPGGFMRRQLAVIGTKGMIELKPIEYYVNKVGEKDMCTDMYFTSPDDVARDGWYTNIPKKTFGPINRYDSMMATFADVVNGSCEMPYSYQYESELHRLLMQACGYRD